MSRSRTSGYSDSVDACWLSDWIACWPSALVMRPAETAAWMRACCCWSRQTSIPAWSAKSSRVIVCPPTVAAAARCCAVVGHRRDADEDDDGADDGEAEADVEVEVPPALAVPRLAAGLLDDGFGSEGHGVMRSCNMGGSILVGRAPVSYRTRPERPSDRGPSRRSRVAGQAVDERDVAPGLLFPRVAGDDRRGSLDGRLARQRVVDDREDRPGHAARVARART